MPLLFAPSPALFRSLSVQHSFSQTLRICMCSPCTVWLNTKVLRLRWKNWIFKLRTHTHRERTSNYGNLEACGINWHLTLCSDWIFRGFSLSLIFFSLHFFLSIILFWIEHFVGNGLIYHIFDCWLLEKPSYEMREAEEKKNRIEIARGERAIGLPLTSFTYKIGLLGFASQSRPPN